ncbi:sporulation initiation inhibitor Soj [Clostridia bacterium]|nr:sporulation initiation inhibitor Soj [Clostridia bacterium]
MAMVICVSNQKGGVAKSVTCVNLGIGLARHGKKVLIIDTDAQASLTISLGWQQPDTLPVTITTIMRKIIEDEPVSAQEGILSHAEGVDVMPACIDLSGIEISLANVIIRETILRQYVDIVREHYDYVLLDTSPSLGMISINALASADKVLIPVQAQYLPVKGLELLMQSIAKIRRQINPKLSILGILMTMVDSRTNYAKEISTLLKNAYADKLHIFENDIQFSVRAAEISTEGKSIFAHDPKGKVAQAYEALTQEVLADE